MISSLFSLIYITLYYHLPSSVVCYTSRLSPRYYFLIFLFPFLSPWSFSAPGAQTLSTCIDGFHIIYWQCYYSGVGMWSKRQIWLFIFSGEYCCDKKHSQVVFWFVLKVTSVCTPYFLFPKHTLLLSFWRLCLTLYPSVLLLWVLLSRHAKK